MFEAARQQLGLTPAALWWAYFGLGGTATPLEFGGFLSGETQPDRGDHDRLSQALNERFTERGQDNPVPSFDTWHTI
jgi:hypothetical protein